MTARLVLASQSPRRSELLNPLGLEFDVIPSFVEEGTAEPEFPQSHVLRLAEAKAEEVGSRYPDRWVIAADTVVFVDGHVLGKPGDRREALEMLRQLSGREHWVVTGFCVRHVARKTTESQAVQTAVTVKPLTPVEMEWYVNTGEPFDKAGAYAIQGIGSFMIESIRGSYTNVVGLPVCEVIQALGRLGAITISSEGIQVAR